MTEFLDENAQTYNIFTDCMQKAARCKVKRLRFLSQKDFTKRDSYGIILQNPISIIVAANESLRKLKLHSAIT